MQIKNLSVPFEVVFLETNQYAASEYRNTYFELVFILEGSGVQVINDHSLPYSKDKLFLLFPQDSHSFSITEKTQFLFLRFNKSYLQTLPKEWLSKMEYIFCNHNHLPGCILKNVVDKPLVRAIMEGLYREEMDKREQVSHITQYLLNAVIAIAARNIALQENVAKYSCSHSSGSLLSYVHSHIKDPEQLKISVIATQFNISQNYVSEYFKKQTGESLQNYIMTYKMQLILARLKFTSQRLNEIALDFGFSDTSHLDKLFKKYFGQTPGSFRKNILDKNTRL